LRGIHSEDDTRIPSWYLLRDQGSWRSEIWRRVL